MKIRKKYILLFFSIALVACAVYYQYQVDNYEDAVSMYKAIRMGMTASDIDAIFTGQSVPEPQAMPEEPGGLLAINADSFQFIPVNVRVFRDYMCIYYREGIVIGKQMIGYDPYPEKDFPTIKKDIEPNKALEPTPETRAARI